MTDTLTPQELGVLGENLAVQWLEDRHYTIVDRNVRIPGIRGELDIIAFDTETTELVFVEVKTRTTTIAGWPEEAITHKKARTIRMVASEWLSHAYEEPPEGFPDHRGLRFDVLSLLGNPTEGFSFRHFRDVLS